MIILIIKLKHVLIEKQIMDLKIALRIRTEFKDFCKNSNFSLIN